MCTYSEELRLPFCFLAALAGAVEQRGQHGTLGQQESELCAPKWEWSLESQRFMEDQFHHSIQVIPIPERPLLCMNCDILAQ